MRQHTRLFPIGYVPMFVFSISFSLYLNLFQIRTRYQGMSFRHLYLREREELLTYGLLSMLRADVDLDILLPATGNSRKNELFRTN